jgi:uracil-DNA glycosylase
MKPDWQELLTEEFNKDYYINIQNFLKRQTAEIYPKKEDIFKVYEFCSLNNIKVLIIGQDPYHTPGVAHGLAFSTTQDKRPPSYFH